jgi:integrase
LSGETSASLGLRASEIMGLQWSDFNWDDSTVLIRRGVVNGRREIRRLKHPGERFRSHCENGVACIRTRAKESTAVAKQQSLVTMTLSS